MSQAKTLQSANTRNQETDAGPWYKEPWPFILVSITGLGVVAGSTLAFIGLSNPPEIVSGDFEQLGRGLTDTNVRTAQARNLGLEGQLSVEGDEVVLTLKANQAESLPERLLLQFQHPARSEGDSTALLQRGSDGHYRGGLGQAPHPNALVIVSDLEQSWWLAGRGAQDGLINVAPRRL